MPRIRIVVRRDGQRTRQRRLVVGSLVVHAVLAIVAVWLPGVRGSARIPTDAIMVELVGALPGPPAPASGGAPPPPAPQAEPEPEPEKEPEGVKVETQPPKIVPPGEKKKPEEKKEPIP